MTIGPGRSAANFDPRSFRWKGSPKTALLDTVDPFMANELPAQLAGVPKIDFIVKHKVNDFKQNAFTALLTWHIATENSFLFPMADAKLDAKKDIELFEAFEKLERERIGPGQHEEFHVLLDQLQKTYLV